MLRTSSIVGQLLTGTLELRQLLQEESGLIILNETGRYIVSLDSKGIVERCST
jgi:hypothetical protein